MRFFRPDGVRGFTLIEVLVAVTIVGIALPALLFSIIQRLDGTAYMRERMIASWVAVNVMTDIHIYNIETRAVPEDGDEGSVEMANIRWNWESTFEETSTPDYHRISVRVWPAEGDSGQSMASLISYIADFEKMRSENKYISDRFFRQFKNRKKRRR